MYFNKKYDRVGPLFQGVYKAVQVESDLQLLHLSSYIHRNPIRTKKLISQGEALQKLNLHLRPTTQANRPLSSTPFLKSR